ncbi:arylsulfatase B-like [Palaemon carinicauda]|uniref:arylsulfatase B-like n=1 Tax=Palaemon carinicauda TaxID=392227 RepID=UPI0035B5F5DC
MGLLLFSRGYYALAVLLGLGLVMVHISEVSSQQVGIYRRESSEAPPSTPASIFERFALTARTKWQNFWGENKEAPSTLLTSIEDDGQEEEEDSTDVFERQFLEDPFFEIDPPSREGDEIDEEEEDSEEVFERQFLEDPYFDLDDYKQDVDEYAEADSEEDFERQFIDDPIFDIGNSQFDVDEEETKEEVKSIDELKGPLFKTPFFEKDTPQHHVFDIKRMKRKLQQKKQKNFQKMKKMKQRKQRQRRKKHKKYTKNVANRRMDRLREAKEQASKAEEKLEFFRREKQSQGHVSSSGRRYLRPAPERPNIILIVADDLGYNDVPWHNPDVKAPNIRKLARQGIILENHYVLPLCTPSRAALLTGVYPFRYGKQAGESLPLSPTGLNASITLLPERLKTLGYSTHLIGKWHLGYCSWDYTPTRRGFDSFYGFYLGSQTYYTQYKKMGRRRGSLDWWGTNEVELTYDYEEPSQADPSENLKDDQLKKLEESKRGQGRRRFRWYGNQDENGGRDFRFNELPLANLSGFYSNDLYAERAEEVIKAHAVTDGVVKSPLFMMLSTQAVHGPVQVPLKYRRRHTATTKNLARRTFLGMVDALDDVVGRVVDQLKTSGLYRNSIILFTTDNGGNIQAGGNNFPLRGCKGGLYEGGTKGVAFIHSPLLPKSGFKYNGMMHMVDLHETILHVAQNGGSPPQGPGWRRELLDSFQKNPPKHSGTNGRDGVNMWPAILTNTESPRNSFVYNVRKKPLRGAVRRKNWKLIIGEAGKFDGWVPPSDVSAGAQDIDEADKCCSTWHSRIRDRHLALYNLKDDPLETTDVSYLNPNVTSTLKSLLKKYAAQSRQPHLPREDPLGHPSLHDGFFSPGWCQAIV